MSTYLARDAQTTLLQLAKGHPIVGIIGPRQSGKTTLSQHCFPDKKYISLEDPDQALFAQEDPRGFLARFPDGAIFDEIQRCPLLFSYLQTLVDKKKQMGQFIISGSQNFNLLEKITQSLAGRIGLLTLLPFNYHELQQKQKNIALNKLLLTGCYPPLYDRKISPSQWYNNYITTYLERDVRQIININDLGLFQRFIRLCAARNAQLLNLSNLATACGVSHVTIRTWLSVLEASYIIILLQPFFENFGKRLVKTPKLYFYDTGLVAALLNIHDEDHLAMHPMRGALFETYILGELLKNRFNQGLHNNVYFWRDNAGNEIDFMIDSGKKIIGIETKATQTIHPEMLQRLQKWKTMQTKLPIDLQFVYGGNESYSLNKIAVRSWRNI